MRTIILSLFVFAFAAAVNAQTASTDVLATATGVKITLAELPNDARSIFERRAEIVASNRTKFLAQTVSEMLLAAEANERGIAPEKILTAEFEKLPKPTDAQIKAVYDANQSALGGRPMTEVRNQIVAFLMREPEEKAENDLLARLRVKHKYGAGVDVNAKGSKPTDVLFSIAGKPFSVLDFETKERIALNDVEVHIYEELLVGIDQILFNKLIEKEAIERKVDSQVILATEITDKMRDFSDGERMKRLTAFQESLFRKYAAKILLPEPKRLVLNVSADDDPSIGPATAPVTVVMFIDYQCSTCAAFGPVVKQVAAEFGPRVRLVVRDFPLESIHENAFRAALAANAAARQGKFFEYGALLYGNQASLDEASLLKYAEQLGLNAVKFKADIIDPKNTLEVRKDIADGESYGVGGTPTIFINGVKHHSLTEPKFRLALEKAFNAVK